VRQSYAFGVSEMDTDRIITGDCRDKSQQIEPGSVDLVLTDPPYGTLKGASLKGWTDETTEWDDDLAPETIFDIANRILRVKGKLILLDQGKRLV